MSTTEDVAKALGNRFVQRRDVKAIQRANGAYNPVEEPWVLADLVAHVEGQKTYGHYLVDAEGRTRLFAFDIDFETTGTWRSDPSAERQAINPREVWFGEDSACRRDLLVQLRCMAEGLAIRTHRLLEIPVAVSYSGHKGMHVYAFTGPVDASDARAAAVEVLDSFGVFAPSRGHNFYKHTEGYDSLAIEVFPKQDKISEGGFGNLLRLPLGINQKSGQYGVFVDLRSGYDRIVADNPLAALTNGSLRDQLK